MSAANGTQCSASAGNRIRLVIPAGRRRTTVPRVASPSLAEMTVSAFPAWMIAEQSRNVGAHAVNGCDRHGERVATRDHDRGRRLPAATRDELHQRRVGRQCLRHGRQREMRCVERDRTARPSRQLLRLPRAKQAIAEQSRAPALRELECRRNVPRGCHGTQHRCRAEIGTAESIGDLKREHAQCAVAQSTPPAIHLICGNDKPAFRIGGIARREPRSRETALEM